MRNIYLAPLLAALLAACAPPAGMSPPADVQAGPESFGVLATGGASATVSGRLQVYDAAGYRLLGTMTAYNPADVTKVVLHLMRQGAGDSWSTIADTTLAIDAVADLAEPVTISNLKMGKTYKVNAEAYGLVNGQEGRIDNGAAADNTSAPFTAPSIQASGGKDTISTDTTSLSLPIKLANKTYQGEATSGDGLTITNGTIIDPTAAESF